MADSPMTACYDGAAMADPHPSGRVSQPGPRDSDRSAADNGVFLGGLLLGAAILLELVSIWGQESTPVPPLLPGQLLS